MSVKFDDFLQKQLQDPEFKKEYEALQPEHAIIQSIIDARQQSGLTQKDCIRTKGRPYVDGLSISGEGTDRYGPYYSRPKGGFLCPQAHFLQYRPFFQNKGR